MQLRRNHSLCSHELADEPIILRRRHVLPWPRRQRRQQLLRRAELAADIAGAVQATAFRVLAPVSQAGTPPTRQPLVSQVEMEDLPRARRAQEVPLPVATVVPKVAHNVDRLGLAVDEDGDRRLAREGAEGRGGCPLEVSDADPWCCLDGASGFAWSTFTEDGEGHVEIYSMRTACGCRMLSSFLFRRTACGQCVGSDGSSIIDVFRADTRARRRHI